MTKGQHIFMLTFKRYIDDLFKVQCLGFDFNSILYFKGESDGMYPSVLEDDEGRRICDPLKLSGDVGAKCDFLDATIIVDPKFNRLTWTLYDKSRTLTIDNSPMSELRNSPHWDTMLSKACKLGVITMLDILEAPFPFLVGVRSDVFLESCGDLDMRY
jgi:hypothetical protein